MQSLLTTLNGIFGDAFESCGMDRSAGAVVISGRPDLSQFQCNGAIAGARALGRNPRELAQAVIDALQRREIFSALSLAGPGFINITLTDEFLGDWANRIAADERLGCPVRENPQTVIIDFGGPNVAKAMHVGHLRSTIIGDSLQRLFRFAGDNVTSDVHLGDWGKQMGQLITEVRRERPELPYFDPEQTGPYPEESPVTIEELEELYPRASARSNSDEEADEEARVATAELQAGRPGYRALWRHFVNVSTVALKRDYASLGIRFDLWLGESDAQERIPAMLERLRAGGFVEESRGAQVIQLPAAEGEAELPPLILIKGDGGVMYGTTDLATLEQRVDDLHADVVLYVVDERQRNHFNQVFRAARRTGIAADAQLEHIWFGTMNGTDGRPFKTREGGVMKLGDLIAMATREALERMEEAKIAAEYPADERAEIARMVGIAAIKYADLMNNRESNYVFDLANFTRFEGRTGAYLLYACVRSKSILRKAAERGFASGAILPPTADEHELLLRLAAFPEAVAIAHRDRMPSYLCEHIFVLAQALNRFYAKCHILTEENAERRASWLRIVETCARQFELVLGLLGIEVPERM